MALDNPQRTTGSSQVIRFLRRGEVVTLGNVPPTRTLLEVLREDLACTGTKEGCGEGDCGACTVVIGEPEGGEMRFKAVNSCIRLAHSVDGLAVWTVEDIAALDGTLHPAQQALLNCHASQCGFCTPGFVMSLFAMYQNHTQQGRPISRARAQVELAGNLCRCTGYRPILDAAQTMALDPAAALNAKALLAKITRMASHPLPDSSAPMNSIESSYQSPRSLKALLQARSRKPQAQLVAGCTDVGLWVTKQHQLFGQVIDLTRVAELKRIEDYPHHIAIGAAVSLEQAFDALCTGQPQLKAFAQRFAGLPVRNSGTLGGNVANGSPIGDSMPLLIAMRANVVLMKEQGGLLRHREFALEQLYTGYRQNVMVPSEVLAWVKIPKLARQQQLRIYKISKRFDDDISAICLAICLQIESGVVAQASIGVGGVAATPMRAAQTEAALLGQPWTLQTVQRAMTVLRAEFSPISDMRASSDYRRQVLGQLLQRYWLESQGMQAINLQSSALEAVACDTAEGLA